METGLHSSFIPQDAGTPVAARRTQSGMGDLVILAATVLFTTSAALAGAVFLYQQFLDSQSASKLQQLQRAEAAFQPALIAQLTRLDDRMRAAQKILNAHMAPSILFLTLQTATLQTVSFQSLKLSVVDPQHVQLKMQGVAQSVNSIALQADIFSQSGVLSDPIFSNIDRQEDGVHFDFSALINPASLGYAQLVAPASASAPSASASTSTPPAPAPASSSAPAGPSAGASPFGGQSGNASGAPAQY